MGYVKNRMMELEEQGDWPDGLSDKYVCANHYSDKHLNRYILQHGEDGVCSYCGKPTKVCNVETFAKHITWHIHDYYNDIDEENLPLASSYYEEDDEEIPGLKRVGCYVAPTNATKFESNEEMMGALDLWSDNNDLDEDIVNMFSTNHWIKRDCTEAEESVQMIDEWLRFTLLVTHEQRFTFWHSDRFAKAPFGDDMLQTLQRVLNEQGTCRILGKGTTLYRSRNVSELSTNYQFEDLTSPPNKSAFTNRMSPAGISMFYASFEKDVAMEECIGNYRMCVVGQFETIRDLQIVDLTTIPNYSFWMDDHQGNLFLHRFHKEISKPLDEGDRNRLRYIPTQVFTEFLRYMFKTDKGKPIYGLIYGSAKKIGKRNVVLFCNQVQSKNFVKLVSYDKINFQNNESNN